MVLGVAFEFPFWDIFDFREDLHSLSSVLVFFVSPHSVSLQLNTKVSINGMELDPRGLQKK